VQAGEEMVVTRNGKPFALLAPTEPAQVDETLKLLRLRAFQRAWQSLARQAQAGDPPGMTDKEIQAEVKAVRRERGRAARSH
jgi:antitoxin (DNA-binding transcriptional repressor) of toxin-antitoxin stability system